jgi:hypothetical protein
VPADDDVAAGAAVLLLLLLLPQPTIPAKHSTGSTPASQPFEVRIALPYCLKNESGLRAEYATNDLRERTINPPPTKG